MTVPSPISPRPSQEVALHTVSGQRYGSSKLLENSHATGQESCQMTAPQRNTCYGEEKSVRNRQTDKHTKDKREEQQSRGQKAFEGVPLMLLRHVPLFSIEIK